MTTWLLLALGMMALAAGIAARRRVRAARRRELDQEMIRRIEETGRLSWDAEDLDLEAIREEEDRFWEQTWDDPEPL